MGRAAEYKEQLIREPKTAAFWRDVFSELIATFFLVSVQCSVPLTFNTTENPADVNRSAGSVVHIALGMGFVVCTMAWTLGDFGGGHMNPAVSVAMVVSLKMTVLKGLLYIVAQCVGGIAAAAFVKGMTPTKYQEGLSATTIHPDLTVWQGFGVETWITCLLVLTILGSTNVDRKQNIYMATIPIGFAVACGIMAGINHTGASMNPARSLGPAVLMGIWADHWVYWIGPILGGLIATVIYTAIFDRIPEPSTSKDFNDNKEDIGLENGAYKPHGNNNTAENGGHI